MYRSKNRQQLEFPDFYLPFSGHLDPENCWVALAQLVPWELAEEIYHADLCKNVGQPIVPARVALGALLIKERQGLTDRETVETIAENPYMQFFLGKEEFTQEPPFDASLMVDFRKRFGEEGMQRLSEAIALASLSESQLLPTENETENESKDDSGPPANRGKMIADATCAPADIRYPTDVSLLNEAREKTEEIIDELHMPLVGKTPRPRTYRKRFEGVLLLSPSTKSRGARKFDERKGNNCVSCAAISKRLTGCLKTLPRYRSASFLVGSTRTCGHA